MKNRNKIIFISIVSFFALILAINLETSVILCRKGIEYVKDKYRRHQYQHDNPYKINPKGLIASYWLEKTSDRWSLVLYLKNNGYFSRRTLVIQEHRSLGRIDSLMESTTGFRHPRTVFFLKTDIIADTLVLSPRQEKEYRYAYNDSIWIVVLDEKGETSFGAPLWAFNTMFPFKMDIALREYFASHPREEKRHPKITYSARDSSKAIWNQYDNWTETLNAFPEMPDGIYWPAMGILAKLNYPEKPIVSFGDSFSLTYYFKFPTMLFKEWEADTLYMNGSLHHRYIDDHNAKSTYDFRMDSKSVAYSFSREMDVVELDDKTCFSVTMAPERICGFTIITRVKSDDVTGPRTKYSFKPGGIYKHTTVKTMWFPYSHSTVKYWGPGFDIYPGFLNASIAPYRIHKDTVKGISIINESVALRLSIASIAIVLVSK